MNLFIYNYICRTLGIVILKLAYIRLEMILILKVHCLSNINMHQYVCMYNGNTYTNISWGAFYQGKWILHIHEMINGNISWKKKCIELHNWCKNSSYFVWLNSFCADNILILQELYSRCFLLIELFLMLWNITPSNKLFPTRLNCIGL